jgi:hypothetical protein
VFSAGFLSVTEEAQYWKFLSVCPSIVPFLEGENPPLYINNLSILQL